MKERLNALRASYQSFEEFIQTQKGVDQNINASLIPGLMTGIEATIPRAKLAPNQSIIAAERTDAPLIEGDRTFEDVEGREGIRRIPTIPAQLLTTSDAASRETQPLPTSDTIDYSGYSSFPGAGEGRDLSLDGNLSRAAKLANFAGTGVDLSSSLYLLGKGIGERNIPLTVGAGGKTLLAGSRDFLSGLSTSKRNQATLDYMEEQQRKGLVGESIEVPLYRQDVGGSLFRDGGITKEENAFVSELSKYIKGGKSKSKSGINLSYQEGGDSETSYASGDRITFRDEKGEVVSGVIKEIKDGEIILED